jgi:alpha-galactosidase
VAWPEIGYTAGLASDVRDLWSGTTRRLREGRFSAMVPPHGVVMVKVTPRRSGK